MTHSKPATRAWAILDGKGGDGVTRPAAAIEQHRSEILAIARRNGATSVRIFGSAARGEDGPESDIDLLVELEPGRSLLDHSRLILELEALLERSVHVVTPASLHHSLRARVLAEARPL
jgi:predicted nucleotidyltransferase